MVASRIGALFSALAGATPFVRPTWLSQPTLSPVAVGAQAAVSGGSATGSGTPVISYSLTVNGVQQSMPYRFGPADAGQSYVVTPTATWLGVTTSGSPITGTVPPYSLCFPTMAIGQNAPAEASYTTMRIFNDRALASSFFTYPYDGSLLVTANKDASTGLPTTAFCTKFAEGALMTDDSVTGSWRVTYPAPAQRNVSLIQSGTIQSHTYSGGVGTIIFTNVAGGGVVGLNFIDGGITGPMIVYDPTTYSTWSAGGTPPLFSQQFMGTTPPYAYMRMMDWANANADMVNTDTNAWALDTMEWVNRRTPSNYYLNSIHGLGGGFPLEWMVQACNQAGKPGWFCLPELASDDYFTQYGTYLAQNLSAGLTADAELSNEQFNPAAAFWTYYKSGYMGQTEALAFLPSNTQLWRKTCLGGGYVSTFASDGTTATVVWAGGGHGLATGPTSYVPILKSANTGYSNFAATGAATVVDPNTITYPTARPSTGGAVAATTVLSGSGFIALNSASTLFLAGLVSSIFDFGHVWHIRRAWQMAGLLKSAFTAAGRSASDVRPVLALQAGSGAEAQWSFGAKGIVAFISALSGGGKLSDRFKAVAVGGYLCLDQGGNINSGFGLTSNRLTPQTTAAVLAQLKQMSDVAYGCYTYGTNAAWVKDQGLELWGYEIGLDTVGANDQTTTTQNACTAANADPGIQPLITSWVQSLAQIGFSRIGWFQTSTGTYVTFGCFNLGQTVAEVSSSTPAAGQSPKFKGLMAAAQPWTAAPTRHAVPCTISGYDCTGNEAVVVSGSLWPSLAGANLPATGLYNGTGTSLAYYFWLESATPQQVPLILSGDYTTSGAITITAHICDAHGNPDGSFVLSGAHAATVLGTCTVTMQPGPNYVTLTASANAANVFPHTLKTL